MSKVLQLIYPVEPMPAKRIRGGRSGFYNAKDYSDYLKDFAAFLAPHASLFKNVGVKLTAEFHRSTKRRCDLDNLLKSLMDALTYSAVINDDSQIWAINTTKILSSDTPSTVFKLEELF